MPKDDYFRLVYIILRGLYSYKKEGKRIGVESLAADVLGIPEAYRNDILEEMLEEGYTKGYQVKRYVTGAAITGLDSIDITPKGIEYLQENSTMKKVHDVLKGIKDITPGA